MSFRCGFFNSEEGDRLYFNEDLSSFLEGFIEDGIYEFIDDKMMVTAYETPNMTVNVGRGRAWFNGTWTKIDALYNVELQPSDSVLSRIDAICLTVNKTRAVRDNYIEIISGEGTTGTPQKPTITDEPNIFRHVLAYVTVLNGTTAITQASIENRVGMGTAPFSYPKWENIPSTEDMVQQWQVQFDEFMDHIHNTFDYDAAGKLQNGVDNLAPTYDESATYVEGDFVLDDTDRLKKKVNGSWVPRLISAEIKDMKAAFQAGVDAVYNAVVAEGVTPVSSTPEAIAAAIATIRNGGNAAAWQLFTGAKAYVNKQLVTGTMANQGTKTYTINPGGQQTIPAGYHSGSGYVKANPNQNSGTYTFPAGDGGATKDLGVNNAYRYVNASQVYATGRTQGQADIGYGDFVVSVWMNADRSQCSINVNNQKVYTGIRSNVGEFYCAGSFRYSYSGGVVITG